MFRAGGNSLGSIKGGRPGSVGGSRSDGIEDPLPIWYGGAVEKKSRGG